MGAPTSGADTRRTVEYLTKPYNRLARTLGRTARVDSEREKWLLDFTRDIVNSPEDHNASTSVRVFERPDSLDQATLDSLGTSIDTYPKAWAYFLPKSLAIHPVELESATIGIFADAAGLRNKGPTILDESFNTLTPEERAQYEQQALPYLVHKNGSELLVAADCLRRAVQAVEHGQQIIRSEPIHKASLLPPSEWSSRRLRKFHA